MEYSNFRSLSASEGEDAERNFEANVINTSPAKGIINLNMCKITRRN